MSGVEMSAIHLTKELECDLIVSIATLETEGNEYDGDSVHQVEVRGRNNQVQVCKFKREQLTMFSTD